MKKQLRIGLLGMGVVGTGVCEVLKEQKEKILARTGVEIVITKALASPYEDKSAIAKAYGFELTADLQEILEDPAIDVIVELIGKVNPAQAFIEAALKAKKHVVTANKDLIAVAGEQLNDLAKENEVALYYEASVAGGIPILRTIVTNYLADSIYRVTGIVNGTTNYMLTKMLEKGLSYEMALSQAQALGFAESDPTNDVDGLDAAYKMVILTHFAFGMTVKMEDVEIEGIRQIRTEDIEHAKQFGYEIKLIGMTEKNTQGSVNVSVEPMLVPNRHPLASIRNEYNGVFIESQGIGRSMFYGPGAGAISTATSVVSDLVAIAKNSQYGIVEPFNDYRVTTKLTDSNHVINRYYIVLHQEIALSDLNWVESQRVLHQSGETVFLTKPITKQELERELSEFADNPVVRIMKVMEE